MGSYQRWRTTAIASEMWEGIPTTLPIAFVSNWWTTQLAKQGHGKPRKLRRQSSTITRNSKKLQRSSERNERVCRLIGEAEYEVLTGQETDKDNQVRMIADR